MKLTIETIDDKSYSEFGKQQKNWCFLNSVEQERKLEKRGWKAELAGAYDENHQLKAVMVLACAPVAKIYMYCMIPGGILMDYQDQETVKAVTEALKKKLSSMGVLYVQMSPYLPLQERDQDGQIVENGENNFAVVQELEDLGYLWKKPKPGYDLSQDAMYMSVLDLRGKDMKTLLKEMDQQTRWSINRAKKFDFEVRPAKNEEELAAFTKMMEHTGARNHFDGMDEEYYRKELDAYGDKAELKLAFMKPANTISSQEKLKADSLEEMEEVKKKLEQAPGSRKFNKRLKVLQEAVDLADQKIEEARKLQEQYGDEILMAGSIFLLSDHELTYMHSGAYDEFFKYHAPYAIHAHEIERAIDLGMDSYNFYGISGNFQKEEEGYSLFDFKRGFGCRVVENIGTFILPVKKLEFTMYNKLKQLV